MHRRVACTARGWCLRRQRCSARQRAGPQGAAQPLPDAALTGRTASQSLLLTAPYDVSDGGMLGGLNPFRAVRRGPKLLSITALPSAEAASELTSSDALAERAAQCDKGQDRLTEGAVTSLPRIQRAPWAARRGAQHMAKLVPNACVCVDLDDPDTLSAMNAAGVAMGMDIGQEALSRNPHFRQSYGTIVEVHAEALDVHFRGLWCPTFASSIALHYETEAGFYGRVHPDRATAHARFRNLFVTTSLPDLRWEVALAWPQLLCPEDDVQYVHHATGERGVGFAGTGIADLVRGDVSLMVQDARVDVLDPFGVIPKGSGFFG